ncbi:MAG: hypothetical protein L0Y72_11385 [Gemmataceae bacterium]|nr:hypothetical protein [Gemmataceae bacterium]MCI0739640.1 hypothetical protein [Gemmataceae bacterium]
MIHGFTRLLLVFTCAGFLAGLAATAQEKKKEKDPLEGKKGKTIGKLMAKDAKKGFIEVKADGEEKPRRYVPQWKGGLPADGGGFDKNVLKVFEKLEVGSRIEVEWVFEERLRALKVKLLAPPKEKDS